MLRIKLVKSLIGQKPVTKVNVKSLGLGKIGSTVERNDTPQIRGMVHRIRHMVTVEEVEGTVTSKHAKPAGTAPKKEAKPKAEAKPVAEKAPAKKPAAKKAATKKEDK